MHFRLFSLSRNVGGMHPTSEAGVLYEEFWPDESAAYQAYQNPGAQDQRSDFGPEVSVPSSCLMLSECIATYTNVLTKVDQLNHRDR
jgi:hypothetical protein